MLRGVGIRFRDSFIFASVGFAAHMFEDALVFNPAYRFLWPLSSQRFGLGVLDYSPDLFGVADSQVLVIGLFMVALCAMLRTMYEGGDWMGRMFRFSQGT